MTTLYVVVARKGNPPPVLVIVDPPDPTTVKLVHEMPEEHVTDDVATF